MTFVLDWIVPLGLLSLCLVATLKSPAGSPKRELNLAFSLLFGVVVLVAVLPSGLLAIKVACLIAAVWLITKVFNASRRVREGGGS
jgi:hypothetical protein